MLSLFLIPYRSNYGVLENGADVPVRPGRGVSVGQFACPIRVYSDGELIYMMVVCDPGSLDGAAAALEIVAGR